MNFPLYHLQYHMYANDFQMYLSITSSEPLRAIKKLKEDLNRICHWTLAKKLNLNAEKAKAIVIASNHLLTFVPNPSTLFLNNNPIKVYSFIINFGITLDQSPS